MKVVALISGGKDSCYNMQLCESYGHEIAALANLLPLNDAVDELDSFMYQTVGHQVVAAIAQCMGLPLFRRRIQGSPRAKDLRYSPTEGDEVEDLEMLLRAVKSRIPDLRAVSTGAIASDYQRLRVENVCSRLGLISLAYMWKQEQASLLQNMIDSGLQAVLVKVAAMGLDPHKHLGKDLATLQPLFMKLQDLYGCNVCGEGGEYESLTLDCPLFKNAKIVLDDFTVRLHSPDIIAPVGVLHATEFHLEYKSVEPHLASTGTVWDETNDFVTNNDIGETLAAAAASQCSLKSTGSLPCQDAFTTSELCTDVLRQRHGFVAIRCWQKVDLTREEMQNELGVLLVEIERLLQMDKLSWANVLYVHLYLNDMQEFSKANEMYVQHITEKNSGRGVPSRCCVEIPLGSAGMGQVAVEILASTELGKKVLHVQSISCWAPCCIGPYSQATQHQHFLHMAGQLGLDPPTMSVVPGGAAPEMAQALKNCEAVGEVFTQPFINFVLSFIVYCSSPIGMKGIREAESVLNKYLSRESGSKTSSNGGISAKPLVLYILLPALPKGALVEVAPLTYIAEPRYDPYPGSDEEADGISWELISKSSNAAVSAGVEAFSSCCGLARVGSLCRAVALLSYQVGNPKGGLSWSLNSRVALQQTFELMSSLLAEAALSWADVFVLRMYFISDKISADGLQQALEAVVDNSSFDGFPKPMLIPVLGVGDTSELQGLIAVELTASSRPQ